MYTFEIAASNIAGSTSQNFTIAVHEPVAQVINTKKLIGKRPVFKTETLKAAKWNSNYTATFKLANMKATT